MDINITTLLKTGFKLTALFSFFIWKMAIALPQDGSVAAGAASINQSSSQVIINQTSQSAVINWSSFDTAASESVLFHQPNSSSIALNKINSGLPTNFNGNLSANGQVWIINPAGVLFGSSANINVAGLVATTNNISNNNFMAGNYIFEAPTNLSASIINSGNINITDSGVVALVGPNVINNGVITANLGTVQLSTGGAFVLDLNGDGLINFGSNSSISNGSVANNNLIQATGGKVLMTANAAAGVLDNVISMSGTIEATTATTGKNGEIILNGGNSGTTYVSGKLIAPQGHIETSGHVLILDPNVVIDASNGGSWLIDPWDITVVATIGTCTHISCTPPFTPNGTNSQIGSNLIINQLNAGTSVTLDTTSGGSDAGNITILSAIAATTNSADFTLLADNNISINAALSIRGAFNATATAGQINIGANVTSTGTQTYNQSVVVTANSVLTSTAGAINFGDTVDDSATRSHTLTVIAASEPTFSGAVGGTTSLNTLAITYPALTVDAATASLVSSQLNKGTNVTLTASSGNLTLSSPITQTINAAANTLSLVSGANFNLGSSITLIGTTLAFTAPTITIDSTFAAYIVGQLNAGTLVELIGEGGAINVTSPIVTSSGTAELAFFDADVAVSADIITGGAQVYNINTNGNSLTVGSGATVAAAGGISVDSLVVTAGGADITINGTLGTIADRSAVSFNISDSPVFGPSSTVIATTFNISGTRGASVTLPAGITLDITSSLTITTDTTTDIGQIIVNGQLGLPGQPIPFIQLQGGFVSGGSAVAFAPNVFIYAGELFLRYIRDNGGGIIISNQQTNWHLSSFVVDTEISQASGNIFRMTSTAQIGSPTNPVPTFIVVSNFSTTVSGIQIQPGAQIYATNLTFNDPRTGFISLDNGSINAYHVSGVMEVISGNPNTFAPFGPTVINGIIGAPGDLVGTLEVVGTTITLNAPSTGGGSNTGIMTSGSQIYFDPVIVGSDQTLNSSGNFIDFESTVNAATSGVQSLTTLAGADTIFLGAVGATKSLNNLSITGATFFESSATIVDTTGDQTYNGAVNLFTNPVVLTSTGGNITFDSTVNGATVGGTDFTTSSFGTTTFDGAVGNTFAPATLTTTGMVDINGGSIITTSSQTYNNQIFLDNPNSPFGTTLQNTVSGNLTFDAIDANALAANPQGLTLISPVTSTIHLTGNIGTANELLSSLTIGLSGIHTPVSIETAIIDTSTAQTYWGPMALTASPINLNIINSTNTGGTITFENTINGNSVLTVNTSAGGAGGTVNFNNIIGATTALNSLTVAGGTAININTATTSIKTANSQTYNGPILFNSLAAMNFIQTVLTSPNAITFNKTVNSKTTQTALTITGNLAVGSSGSIGLTFSGGSFVHVASISVSGTTLGPNTNTSGDQTYSGAVTLNTDETMISTAGTITYSSTVDGDGVSGRNLTVNAAMTATFTGAVGSLVPLNSLTVTAPTNININGGSIHTVNNQLFNSAVVLGANTTFTSDSGSIRFANTVAGVTSVRNLITSAAIDTEFDNTVGNTNLINNITVTGPVLINTTAITSQLLQTYNNAVTIGANANLTGTTITFVSTVDDATAGTHDLTITGNMVADNNIGSTKDLNSLTVTGTSHVGGNITTAHNQLFQGAYTLTTDNTLTSNSGSIAFNNTVNGGFNLIANAATTLTFGGAVGGTTPLTSLTATGASGININGGSIHTVNNQLFNSAVVLGANTTLTSNSGNITFVSTVNGAFNLSASAASGAVIFDEIVGTTPLNSLTVTGTADINTTAITTVNNQLFNNAVVLGSDSTLTSNSGNITFGSTLDGGFNLITSVVSPNKLTFSGAVGNTTALTSVTTNNTGTTNINGGSVTTTGAQNYNNPVVLGTDTILTSTASGALNFNSINSDGTPRALTLSTGALATLSGNIGTVVSPAGILSTLTVTGTTDIATGIIDTITAQNYDGAVTLGAATIQLNTNAGGTITFGSTVDGASNLTINATPTGTVIFNGIVGAAPALTSLTVTGTADINTTAIITANNQLFNNAVVLGSNSILTSNSGNITFGGTVDGAFDLSASAASGAVIFNGIVGTTPLSSLTVTGTADINTTAITTTNNQLFNNAVVLGSDTTLTSTTNGITFASTVDSDSTPRALTVNAFLPTVLTGNIGNISILKSLEIINEADIITGIIKTTISQLYDGIVKIGANAVLTTPNVGGFITFFSTLDGDGTGPWNLTVNTSTARFKNIIGGINALNEFIVNANIINFDTNATAITTIDEQDYTGATAMTIGADPVFTGSSFIINIPLILLLDTTYTSTAGNIDFQSTVDGPANLFLNPASAFSAMFEGNVGSITPLASLIVTGDTTINSGANSITTNGDQNYSNNIFLNNSLITTALTTGAIFFGDQTVPSSGVQTSSFDLTAVTNNSANGPTGAGITGIVRVNNFTVGGPGGANLSFNYPAAESFVLGQGAAQAIQNTGINPDFRPAAIYCVNNFCAMLPSPVTPSNPIPNNVPPTQEFIPPEGPGCSASGCDNLTIIVYDVPPYNGFGFPPGTIVYPIYPAGSAGITGVVSGICGNPPIAVDEFGVPRKLHVGSVVYKYDTVIADKYSCTCIKTNSHETKCTHDTKNHPKWTAHCETCQINKLDKNHYVKSKSMAAKKYDSKNTLKIFAKHWWHYPLSDHDLFVR